MRSLNEWCEEVHARAKEKGWYDSPRSPLEYHMLMVSEIAEASEEVRNGSPDAYYLDGTFNWGNPENSKPEGEIIELADAVIRIMDYFGFKGWDLEKAIELKHKYNQTREYRHGGKKL